MRQTLMILGVALVLGSCGLDQGAGKPGISESASRALHPADPALAEIYQRSCRSCHTLAATGAPLTGDRDAWAARLAKGDDVLLESVIAGYGGMPPFGLCMDCDAEQFGQLIAFMAGGGLGADAP